MELAAPDGELWVWGPENAAQRVTGSAVDFCYLVTQRRPRAELDVAAHGADAEKWLAIAQALRPSLSNLSRLAMGARTS